MNYSVEKTIDKLGRIVIPKNIREHYGISLEDKIKMIPTEQGILIVKSDASKEEK